MTCWITCRKIICKITGKITCILTQQLLPLLLHRLATPCPSRSCSCPVLPATSRVLDFFSSTDVGRRVTAEAEEDAVSAVSELEVWEWMEEHGAGTEEPGAGGEPPLFLPTPDFMASAETG